MRREQRHGPLGPKGRLWGGHAAEFGRDPLAALSRWSREYGEAVPLQFGPWPALLITRPEWIDAVFVAQNRDFRKPPSIRRLAPLIGNGLVASEGEFWLRQRRLVQPAFHRDRIAEYSDLMVQCAEDAAAGWRDGDVRQLDAEMSALTLRVVARALFGTEVDVPTFASSVGFVSEHLQSRLNGVRFFIPDWLPTPGNVRMKRAVRRLDRVLYRVIAERRASGDRRHDLLGLLLAARDAEGGGMSDRQLRDEATTLMIAGHDTTATTLTWAWYLLARHPAAERVLHAELETVLAGRRPTAADVARLRYAEQVIYEALRLYPVAYATGRQAIRDTEIGGHRVRRGTIVVLPQWAMHRDPRYFEEPGSFRPERWADSLVTRLPRGVYFPFGGGPRQCIGAAFAMMEAVLVLVTFAQRLRLSLVSSEEVAPEPRVTLRPSEPILAKREGWGAASDQTRPVEPRSAAAPSR